MSEKIICQRCNKECEVITITYQEPHDVHGSKVWVTVDEDVSECCRSSITEIDDEEI